MLTHVPREQRADKEQYAPERPQGDQNRVAGAKTQHLENAVPDDAPALDRIVGLSISRDGDQKRRWFLPLPYDAGHSVAVEPRHSEIKQD